MITKESLDQMIEKNAEKTGDQCSINIAETSDEQACFQSGVEFGYKQGAQSLAPMLLKAVEILQYYAEQCPEIYSSDSGYEPTIPPELAIKAQSAIAEIESMIQGDK